VSITIRDATPADIPAITTIYRDAVLCGTASFELDPPDEAEMLGRFEAIRKQDYPYIVAEEDDGRIAGYAYANAFRTRPAYRWSVEDSVYIDPAAQGRGIGRALLARLIDTTERQGFRQMFAVIGGSHHAASIRLHEALGFELVGVMKGSGYKHGRWLDTVIMQIGLGDGQSTVPDTENYPGTLYRATFDSA
jgi:L-amino acid N-acyltransferase YncA